MSIPNPNTLFPSDIVASNKMLIESSTQNLFVPGPGTSCGKQDSVIVFCIEDMCIFWQNASGSPPPDYKRVMKALLLLRQCIKVSESLMHYDSTTNFFRQYTGADGITRKWVIEMNDELCNSYAGAAHNGRSWCAVPKNLVQDLLNTVYTIKPQIPQVVLYESGRACYDLIFDNILDWELTNTYDYGYWTLGFNGAMTVLAPGSLGYELSYYGQNLNKFRSDRLKDLSTYMSNSAYNFSNTWSQTLLPWNVYQSVNDLMSGLLIDLHDKYGGLKFLSRMFYRLKEQPSTYPRTDRQNRANNLYRACRAAAFDLYDSNIANSLYNYFRISLKWYFISN